LPKNELTFWFDFGFWTSFLTVGFSLPVASFLTEDDFGSIFEKAFATPFFGASLNQIKITIAYPKNYLFLKNVL